MEMSASVAGSASETVETHIASFILSVVLKDNAKNSFSFIYY